MSLVCKCEKTLSTAVWGRDHIPTRLPCSRLAEVGRLRAVKRLRAIHISCHLPFSLANDLSEMWKTWNKLTDACGLIYYSLFKIAVGLYVNEWRHFCSQILCFTLPI
jgi:hypothetical protein